MKQRLSFLLSQRGLRLGTLHRGRWVLRQDTPRPADAGDALGQHGNLTTNAGTLAGKEETDFPFWFCFVFLF